MSDAQLHDKAPGFYKHPNHQVNIKPGRGRATVKLNQVTVADSDHFVVVYESGYEPVVYFPREDVATDRLSATDHRSYCPFKGEASYWTLTVGDRSMENAVWSYESAYAETRALEGLMAFDADQVDAIRAGSE